MRVAQRPGQRDVHRAVGHEGGAVVAAGGDAVLHRDAVLSGERDHPVHQFARRHVTAVHRPQGKAFAQKAAGEARRLQGRIGGDESVHREDIIGHAAGPRHAGGVVLGAVQADFFFHRPHEHHLAGNLLRLDFP